MQVRSCLVVVGALWCTTCGGTSTEVKVTAGTGGGGAVADWSSEEPLHDPAATPDPEIDSPVGEDAGTGTTVLAFEGDGGVRAKPMITRPGFRMLPDGRSVVFVEVDAKVAIQEARAPGRLVYTLENVRVPERVNQLPLPLDYFPTPVGRIRLVQVQDDAELIIELRRPAQHQARFRSRPRGTVLRVEFPVIGGIKTTKAPGGKPQPKPGAPQPEPSPDAPTPPLDPGAQPGS